MSHEMKYQLIFDEKCSNAIPKDLCDELRINSIRLDDVLSGMIGVCPSLLINRLACTWNRKVRSDPFSDLTQVAEKIKYLKVVNFLKSLPKVVCKPGRYAIADDFLSLPMQWQMVAKAAKHIKIPRYEYTYKLHIANRVEGLTESQPDAIYTWQPKVSKTWFDGWNSFFVERQRGVPIVASFFGDSLVFKDVPDLRRSELVDAVTEIRRLFRYEMGEVLFFQVDGGFRFWCISNSFTLNPSVWRNPKVVVALKNLCASEFLDTNSW